MEKYDVDTKKSIGRGAFGAVYLYQRRSDRKDIVIKQITMEDLTTDQRNGVKNEIDVFKRIESHPNIVRYHLPTYLHLWNWCTFSDKISADKIFRWT